MAIDPDPPERSMAHRIGDFLGLAIVKLFWTACLLGAGFHFGAQWGEERGHDKAIEAIKIIAEKHDKNAAPEEDEYQPVEQDKEGIYWL